MQKRLILIPGNVKSVILLAVLILNLISSAEAAVLYQSGYPYISEDGLEVSDFEVSKTGQGPLRVNDTVFVSFTLMSVGDSMEFGDQGVYVKVICPNNTVIKDVKHVYKGDTLEAGMLKKFNTSIIVDQEGNWTLSPVYSFGTENVVYVSDILYSKVKPYANDEIGAYLFVRYRGANYMGINGKSDVLSKIILEMREGKNWTLGEVRRKLGDGAYYLYVDGIDLGADTVNLSLKKKVEVEYIEVSSSKIEPDSSGCKFNNLMYNLIDSKETYQTKNTFVYQKDVDSEKDVPIFSVYVDSINGTTTTPECMLKYVILINDTLTTLKTDPDNILEVVIGTRNPPETPIIRDSTESGETGKSYTYWASTTDPDGDQVKYIFNWTDRTDDTVTEYVDSGLSGSDTRVWNLPGDYTAKVMAEDNNSKISGWSDELTVTIASRPPEKPIIVGEESGNIGKSYTYCAKATDPDGDQIRYTFHWGNGTDNTTTEYVDSGSSGSAGHEWTEPGNYIVTVTAKDEWGEESKPSDKWTVAIDNILLSDHTRLDLETVNKIMVEIIGLLLIVVGIVIIVSPAKPKNVVIEIGIPMEVTGKFVGGVGLVLIVLGGLMMMKGAGYI